MMTLNTNAESDINHKRPPNKYASIIKGRISNSTFRPSPKMKIFFPPHISKTITSTQQTPHSTPNRNPIDRSNRPYEARVTRPPLTQKTALKTRLRLRMLICHTQYHCFIEPHHRPEANKSSDDPSSGNDDV